MRKEYDFTNAKQNPYFKKLKKAEKENPLTKYRTKI